jgi:hypothetical protein
LILFFAATAAAASAVSLIIGNFINANEGQRGDNGGRRIVELILTVLIVFEFSS